MTQILLIFFTAALITLANIYSILLDIEWLLVIVVLFLLSLDCYVIWLSLNKRLFLIFLFLEGADIREEILYFIQVHFQWIILGLVKAIFIIDEAGIAEAVDIVTAVVSIL